MPQLFGERVEIDEFKIDVSPLLEASRKLRRPSTDGTPWHLLGRAEIVFDVDVKTRLIVGWKFVRRAGAGFQGAQKPEHFAGETGQ